MSKYVHRFDGGVDEMRLKGATRFDGSAEVSGYGAWLEEQINMLDDAVQNEILPPDDSNFLVQDVQSDRPRYQNDLRYALLSGSVKAEEIGYRSNDVATVGIDGQEFTAKVGRPAAGIWVDRNEAEIARLRSFDLESFEAAAVVNAIQDYRREMVFNGIEKKKMGGFFGQGTVKSDDRYLNGDTEVTELTGDQAYQILCDSTMLMGVNTKQTFMPNRLLLPSIFYARITCLKTSSARDLSVLREFLENSPIFNTMDQIQPSTMLNYRLDAQGRRVASIVAKVDGTQYARVRRSGLELLPVQNYLKGQLSAWEDNMGDVEILQPNAFRIVNFAGTDPNTVTGL